MYHVSHEPQTEFLCIPIALVPLPGVMYVCEGGFFFFDRCCDNSNYHMQSTVGWGMRVEVPNLIPKFGKLCSALKINAHIPIHKCLCLLKDKVKTCFLSIYVYYFFKG